jgi:hypothetical protein
MLVDHDNIVLRGIESAVNQRVSDGISSLNEHFSKFEEIVKRDVQRTCEAIKLDFLAQAHHTEVQNNAEFTSQITKLHGDLKGQIQKDFEVSKQECLNFLAQQSARQAPQKTSVFLQMDLEERFRILSQEINQRQNDFLTHSQVAGAFTQILEKCKEMAAQNESLRAEVNYLHSEIVGLKSQHSKPSNANPAGGPTGSGPTSGGSSAGLAPWATWGGGPPQVQAMPAAPLCFQPWEGVFQLSNLNP